MSFDWLYLSGVTLAVRRGRADRLFGLLADFRKAGGKVAFDSNFRTRGWPSIDEARREFRRQPSLSDLVSAWRTRPACMASGCSEAAVFHDAGVPWRDQARRRRLPGIQWWELLKVPARRVDRVVDATAAGSIPSMRDSLAAHLAGDRWPRPWSWAMPARPL